MWEGPLHKNQKVVKGGSVYGPGPVRRTLTVHSEISAPPVVPLPLPGRLSFIFIFIFIFTPYSNVRDKINNNHIGFKWSWVQLNVYQNSQSIYISLTFYDYFFIWNSLNTLKNHSRDGLFTVITHSINSVDKLDVSTEKLVFPARLTCPVSCPA